MIERDPAAVCRAVLKKRKRENVELEFLDQVLLAKVSEPGKKRPASQFVQGK